jgi:hypothetical protein
MIEWIETDTKLPIYGQECWVYSLADGVDTATFVEWKGIPRFILDEEYGFYATIQEITHWMPYFTPEPPKEN